MFINSSWVSNPPQMPLFPVDFGTILYLMTQDVAGERERGEETVDE
jgi:hypothetical protein